MLPAALTKVLTEQNSSKLEKLLIFISVENSNQSTEHFIYFDLFPDRPEVDVVAIDSQQSRGDVEDGVDVVKVKVEAAGAVTNDQIDDVNTEDNNLHTE